MKALLTLLTLGLVLLSITVEGKVYSRCFMVRKLKKLGLDGFQGVSLADWTCLAESGSNYDTQATKFNHEDQSTNYGIFQISSRFWCKDKKTPDSMNFCRTSCKALQKSIKASVTCVKRIMKDPQGITTWVTWKKNCQNRNLAHYVQGCGV